MAWLSVDELREELTDVLQLREMEDDSVWDSVIAAADRAARSQIRGTLLLRGYTTAQVLAWDDLESYHRDLAIYWALVNGGTTKNYDETFIDRLNRIGELTTVPVTNGGEVVLPPEEEEVDVAKAGIRSGAASNRSGRNRDRFSFPASGDVSNGDSWGSM